MIKKMVVVALACAVVAASATVLADPLAPLKGGDNAVAITAVNGDGAITVNAKATSLEAAIVKLTGPNVDVTMQCKESGYRCSKVVGADGIAVTFAADKTLEAAKIAANLRVFTVAKNAAANKAALLKTLKEACDSGQTSLRVPIGVRGHCKRVKIGLGDDHKDYAAEEVMASFALTCQ